MAKVVPMDTVYTSFRLLSNNLKSNREGGYTFDQVPILMSTEAMRRQLKRTTRAIRNYDIMSKPWQGVYLHMWLTEYLIPIIHLDEVIKKEVLVPHFIALGEEVPVEKLQYDHEDGFVIPLIEDILETSYFICNCILSSNDNDISVHSDTKIEEAQENLVVLLNNLEGALNGHYLYEEKYWPKVFRKYGPLEVTKMQASKVKYARQMGDAGHAYIATVLFSLGHLTGLTSGDELDVPWCGPRMSHDIVKAYPFFVKYLPPTILFQPFLKYRNVIDVLTREKSHRQDVLGLIPYYRQMIVQGSFGGVEKCFNRPKRSWFSLSSRWRSIIRSFIHHDACENIDNSPFNSSNYNFPWITRASSKLTQFSSSRSLMQ